MDTLTKVQIIRIQAQNARDIAAKTLEKLNRIKTIIPFGQPVLAGHHSESRHRRDLRRIDVLQQCVFSHEDQAARLDRKATRIESSESAKACSAQLEGVKIGDRVRACFTNSGSLFAFSGKVVGQNKNDWKIEADTSPYPNEKPGRIFYIPTRISRKFSKHNRIIEVLPRP